MATETKDEPTREQWMLAQMWSGLVQANNAPFCGEPDGRDNDREEVNRDPAYLDNVAGRIAEQCGRMQLEDAQTVIDRALEIRVARDEGAPGRRTDLERAFWATVPGGGADRLGPGVVEQMVSVLDDAQLADLVRVRKEDPNA